MVSRGSVGVKPEVPPICSRKSNLLESAAPHSLLDILGAAAASSWASMTTRFLLADKLFAGFLSQRVRISRSPTWMSSDPDALGTVYM
eukprot:1191150-Prorocentrum_minimum.AAC.4